MKKCFLTLVSLILLSCNLNNKTNQDSYLSNTYTTDTLSIEEPEPYGYNNPNPQYIDLTEQEAFERFKNSNVRKNLNMKSSDFNFEKLKKKAQYHKVPLSKMIILNNINENNLIQILNDFNRKNIKTLEPCIFCDDIPYYSIYEIKNYDIINRESENISAKPAI